MNTQPEIHPDHTDENPWLKARRLGIELSETLAQCDDGGWAAHIMPKGSGIRLCFSAIQDEHPNQRVDRLSAKLSEALDDYAGGRFHARVYPASQSGHAVYLISTLAAEREGV